MSSARCSQGHRQRDHGSAAWARAATGRRLGGKLEVLLTFQGTLLKAMQAEVRNAGGDPQMFQKKVAYR